MRSSRIFSASALFGVVLLATGCTPEVPAALTSPDDSGVAPAARSGMPMGAGMSHQGPGPMHGTGPAGPGAGHAMGAGGDSAFAADLALVHELLANHQAIQRSVTNLPNGIRTLTESDDPRVAALIVGHVRSMEARLKDGEIFNLFSKTIPVIFEYRDRIVTRIEATTSGIAVVQTSDYPQVVAALQAHAEEVSELVNEGMVAMMRGMMESGGGMGGMHGAGPPHGTGQR